MHSPNPRARSLTPIRLLPTPTSRTPGERLWLVRSSCGPFKTLAASVGAAAEVAAARCGLTYEGPVLLAASPLDTAVCVVYRKIAPTPDWLPRREGMAAKRPLGA